MLESKVSFNANKLPKIYATAFPRSQVTMQRVVCFKAGPASGAIVFSSPFDRNLAGMRERTQNILVVVGDRVVYAAGPANATYQSMQTLKIERTDSRDPNQPVGTSSLPLTTVAVDFGNNVFIVANSKGLVFRGAQSDILKEQSRGIKDVGSDYDLSSSDSLCVFDQPGTLQALTAAWEIERDRRSPVLLGHGMGVDFAETSLATEQLVQREIEIGRAAAAHEDPDHVLAKRCQQLEAVLNSAAAAPGRAVKIEIAKIVLDCRDLGSDEYRALLKKIRDNCALARSSQSRLGIAKTVSRRILNKRNEQQQ